jgi:predicted DNA-binding transcriptional regulator
MILNYLVEHRLAKDTLEGVVQWWIADRAQSPATLDVQLALDELVRRGWVVVTKRSPNSMLYGLEESCLGEIQEFLNT